MGVGPEQNELGPGGKRMRKPHIGWKRWHELSYLELDIAGRLFKNSSFGIPINKSLTTKAAYLTSVTGHITVAFRRKRYYVVAYYQPICNWVHKGHMIAHLVVKKHNEIAAAAVNLQDMYEDDNDVD